eukprot:6349982-Pyramimonas_sp.AAC.1
MDEAIAREDIAVGICSAATLAGFEKVVNSVVKPRASPSWTSSSLATRWVVDESKGVSTGAHSSLTRTGKRAECPPPELFAL